MAKIISGTFLGYTEETREYKDKNDGSQKSFVSKQLHVLDGYNSERLELSRDMAQELAMGHLTVPDRDSEVFIEVSPRVSGSRIYWTALKFLDVRAPAAAGKS